LIIYCIILGGVWWFFNFSSFYSCLEIEAHGIVPVGGAENITSVSETEYAFVLKHLII